MSRLLDIDVLVKEQDEIMDKYQSKDPNDYLKYGTARLMKIYLLKKYAIQERKPFTSNWIISNGKEICVICRIPRKIADSDGMCVGCGAKIVNQGVK